MEIPRRIPRITQQTRITFQCRQAPGDILMITGMVRDLKKVKPELDIGVYTTAEELWENNPYCTFRSSMDKYARLVTINYEPWVNKAANVDPNKMHFLGAMHKFAEKQLGISIPVTEWRGDIHMSQAERNSKPIIDEPYWIIVNGGKTDFTTKWWNPEYAQKVVDHFKGKIKFIQIGDKSQPQVYPAHVHFPLSGVVDMIGRTSIRDLIRLVYHSQGVLCPVTFLMHLSAAVPINPNMTYKIRPTVVFAGGREPPHWEQYEGHRFLHTIGELDCCTEGGCWKRRAQLVDDGQPWNRVEMCTRPIQLNPALRIAECMQMISPGKVIEAIESYYTPVQDITINATAH